MIDDNLEPEDENLEEENLEDSEFFEVQMILINEFGEFRGIKAEIPKFHCDNLIKMSQTFYINGGFELTCEDGSYMVFPPEIVQKSILKINKRSLQEDTE